MAQLQNQHLKVFNRWSAGVQNVPATHLISDQAFVSGKNYDTTDSTIKPVKGNLPFTDIPLNPTTKQIIKENVKGVDTPLKFDNEIDFINYADTVYYLARLDTGSPLMQVVDVDGTTSKAFIKLVEGDIIANVDNSALQVMYDDIRNSITDAYHDLLLATETAGLRYGEFVYPEGADHAEQNIFLHDIAIKILNLPNETNITADNYNESVSALLHANSEMRSLVETMRTILIDTDSEVLPRMDAIVASNLYLQAAMDDNHTDLFPNEDAKRLARHLTLDTDLTKYGVLSVTDDAQILDYLSIAKQMQSIKLFRYLPVYSDYTTEKNLGSLLSLSEKAEATIRKIRNAGHTQQAIDYNKSDDTNYIQTTVLPTYDNLKSTTNTTDIELFYLRYWANYVGNISTRGIPQQEMHTSETVDFNNLLAEYLTTVNDIDTTNKDLDNVGEWAVVAYDPTIGSYSNMLELGAILDDPDITFNVQDPKYTYMYYRKYTSEYKLIEESTNATVTLTAPYSKTGAVPVTPNQISEVHTDYTSIAEYKGSIFLNRKDSQEIWYTDPNSPHTMTTTSYIKMPQDVKAMKTAGAGLFIWTTNNSLFLLTGTPRDVNGNNTLAIKLVGENVNIVSKDAVSSQDSLVIWLSSYGIHYTSGYGSSNSTNYIWTPPNGIEVRQTIVYRGSVYFLVRDSIGESHIYVFDMSRKALNVYDVDVNRLSVIDDKLIGVLNGGAYELFADTHNLVPYSVELKTFAGYSFDTRIRFQNIVVAHSASPYKYFDESLTTDITIYVDDFFVGTWTIQGTDATRISLPVSNNTGQSIKISAEGKLNIKSVRIRYTLHNWED